MIIFSNPMYRSSLFLAIALFGTPTALIQSAIAQESTAARVGFEHTTSPAKTPKDDLHVYGVKEEIAALDQAILANPKDYQAYNDRAILKDEKLNDIQGALSDYNQAILINPKYSEAYNSRAILKKNKLNDIQGALSDYNQAILINPEFSEAYYNRAILKKNKLNNIQGALSDYNQAILINPKFPEAYYNRAILKEDMNDIQGALSDYNQAILINPKYSKAYFNRAILKEDKLNDQTGAIRDFRQAARLYREAGQTQDLKDAIEALQKLGATE
jgi:tetratricopeptide (TPR) repeat protein